MSLGHDAGEVGAALGLLGVEFLQGLSQRRDHGVAGGRRTQHVVGGHAALARVEELGPQQAPHGGRNVHPAEDEARTLAAQLQGDRGEVDGGRLQDDAGHVLRACKEVRGHIRPPGVSARQVGSVVDKRFRPVGHKWF